MTFEKVSQDWIPLEDIHDLVDPFDLEQWLDDKQEHEELYKHLLKIETKKRNVLLYVFGFYDGTEKSLIQAASYFGIHRNTAKKLHDEALEELKVIMSPRESNAEKNKQAGIDLGYRMLLEKIFSEEWDGVSE